MSDMKKLIGELIEAADSHQRDIALINTLARIASLGTSTEDVGHVIFKDINAGDWNETARYTEALIDVTAALLRRWHLSARLAYLNQNREQ